MKYAKYVAQFGGSVSGNYYSHDNCTQTKEWYGITVGTFVINSKPEGFKKRGEGDKRG